MYDTFNTLSRRYNCNLNNFPGQCLYMACPVVSDNKLFKEKELF